jgi:hypothetical protein
MNYAIRVLRICAVLSVIAFGLATAAASASPIDPALPGPASTAGYDGSGSGEGQAATPIEAGTVTGSDGFDWGDAGIGAAGAFALTMIGLGAVIVLSRRHQEERHGVTA